MDDRSSRRGRAAAAHGIDARVAWACSVHGPRPSIWGAGHGAYAVGVSARASNGSGPAVGCGVTAVNGRGPTGRRDRATDDSATGSRDGRAAGHGSMDRDGMPGSVIRMMMRREPMPGPMIAEPHVHAEGSIVPRHEPPDAGVEVPTRLNENVVHPFDDAVAVDPHVVAIAVGPVAVHPDSAGALHLGLYDHDSLRSGRRVLGGGDRRGLLDDDDGLSIHRLGGPVLGFDDDVRGISAIALNAHLLLVAVVGDFVDGRAAVAVGAFVVGRGGSSDRQRSAQRSNKREPS